MKGPLLLLLRLSIVTLCLLPVARPFVDARGSGEAPREVTLLLPARDASQPGIAARARRATQERLASPGIDVRVETRTWGRSGSHPAEDLEELGLLLSNLEGTLVVVPRESYWGPAAARFAQKARETDAFREKRVLLLSREEIAGGSDGAKDSSGNADTFATPPARYLGLSEVFLPKASFLGEESVASLEVMGRLPPGESAPVEVVLRAGSSLLSARTENVTAGDDGVVHTTLQVPVNFVRTGTQALTASISSPHASPPLSTATTVVTVHHGKTTLLHIGVGPDWSLRAFRQKLKFWPNLDLLSYYILREASDDMSIPSSQLSLIEFPAEKLFGSELPNFHGVVAQNFDFDSYLNPTDTANLVRYVADGGRMLLQGGPLSFAARDPDLARLFPCENPPAFDFSKGYAWREGDARVASDVELGSSLRALSSRATALDCRPKKEALVLARTVEGDHPVVLAMPMGKGLVLAILAGDWHLGGLATEADTPIDRTERISRVQGTDAFFQWVVEFLQRRQDGGLRAPDIASPRIYDNDRLLLLKTRGPLRLDESIALDVAGSARGEGKPFVFPWLGLPALRLATRAGVPGGLEPTSLGESGDQGVGEFAQTRFAQVTLRIASRDDPVTRTLEWPLFQGTAGSSELLPNPVLFAQFSKLTPTPAASSGKSLAPNSRRVPLLQAFPWILAALLALLFLERLLVHGFGWRVLPSARTT
jgi:hypothetical protein